MQRGTIWLAGRYFKGLCSTSAGIIAPKIHRNTTLLMCVSFIGYEDELCDIANQSVAEKGC